jgi:hypothetical protein
MRSSAILVTVLAGAVTAASCSGSGGGGSTPTAPGATSSVVTVAISGVQGSGSYAPNPVATNGLQVMFKNNDTINTHHIVMDDGSADFGNLAPGAASVALAVGTGNFHCLNHPSMVGSMNGATAPTPPPGSGDGY